MTEHRKLTSEELEKRLKGDDRFKFNDTKILWHMDRVIARFGDGHHNPGGQRIIPQHMDVGIAKKCNAKCCFCLGIWQQPSSEVMPYDITVNLLRDAGKLGVRSMGVIGDGEPTCNPALYEAVREGRKNGLDIGLATNGILLDDNDKIQTLIENCNWIRFNLGAVEREVYKQVMGVDRWERVKGNIERTIKLNENAGRPCSVGLQMVTTPLSKNQIVPEARWAVEIGADYFEIKQCTLPDDGQCGMYQFPLDWYLDEEVVGLLDEAQSLSNDRTNIVPKWIAMQSLAKRPYDHCLDVSLLVQVSGNGGVWPCAYLFNRPEFKYGDLKEQSLQEIFESDRYWNIVEYMERDFDVHNDCKGWCRHDRRNKFLYNYVYRRPEQINF